MPSAATFESFASELHRLVEAFGQRLVELKQPGYAEAQLRDDFLNPFFRALGWDMENRQGLIQPEREVEIESATRIGGGHKRADYLFRADKRPRFVCEAKKPAEELSARYAFQAKRYAWNKPVPLAVLTDFEELKIYVVGGKPHLDEPHVGEWKSWHFREYPRIARELWDLLGRDPVAGGSIDRAIAALPKRPTGKGKARQQWIIQPDRTRALDSEFLAFLDHNRRALASDLYKHNDHAGLLDGNQLTEACQRVIDRILFLRICEDRDIDTGERLQSLLEKWRKRTGDDDTGRRADQQPMELREEPPADFGGSGLRAPQDSLWRAVVRHFRALDRRPPTHVPFFNGNLFKPHFTETLVIGDEWLAGFIGELSDEESPYLFSEIPVEILGSVYERFLGKVVRPHGKGITVEEKPEVRKAGGVYYTPRYIVDYIVEQTAGKLLDEISGGTSSTSPQLGSHSAAKTEKLGTRGTRPSDKDFEQRTAALRLLDPACGSGSFLIRAFERVCEHWQKRLTADLREVLDCASPLALSDATDGKKRQRTAAVQDAGAAARRKAAIAAWQKKHRPLCWLDETTGDVQLTVELKRKILTQNIYGVDLDSAAVEVTQLSLYLKMLEGENRTTLRRQRELLADETEIALLPPLSDNIKCFNSLISSDFSMMPEDLVRVRAGDWPVQFAPIMKAGGFDAVMGNPPWVSLTGKFGNEICSTDEIAYLTNRYKANTYMPNLYEYFVWQGFNLTKANGRFSFIVPDRLGFNAQFIDLRKCFLTKSSITNLQYKLPFPGITADTLIFSLKRTPPTKATEIEIVEHGKTPMRRKQIELLESKGHAFEYFENLGVMSLVGKLGTNPKIKPLGEMFETTSGFGGKSQLITESQINNRQTPTMKGDSITKFDTRKKYWFEFAPENITGRTTDKTKLSARPKILLRKTGNSIIATYDDSGIFPEQSLYFLFNKKTDADFKFVLGLLNSRLMDVFFKAKCLTNKDSIAQVKKVDLDLLPIVNLDLKKPADKTRHDKLVGLVDKMLGLMPKLHAAMLAAEKAVMQNAVTAADQQIDALVYDLYGLTEAEIKLVEGHA